MNGIVRVNNGKACMIMAMAKHDKAKTMAMSAASNSNN